MSKISKEILKSLKVEKSISKEELENFQKILPAALKQLNEQETYNNIGIFSSIFEKTFKPFI